MTASLVIDGAVLAATAIGALPISVNARPRAAPNAVRFIRPVSESSYANRRMD